MNCRLCNSIINETPLDDQWEDRFGKKYFICRNCSLIQLEKKQILSHIAEKNRYMLHENSVSNKGYITHLNNIIEISVKPFLNKGNRILDFGCGPEKTLADLLANLGYTVTTFDPYFDTGKKWRTKNYDAITAIEVFEHLTYPALELNTLNKCLSPGAYLIIRSMLHNKCWIDFSKWWYKDDPTHITFYSKDTINYICKRWNYELIQIKDQCEIVLKKNL